MSWLELQKTGPVQSFGAVPHTYLNEHSGEMHCERCGESDKSSGNPSRDFLVFTCQVDAFEKFTEAHLHGLVVPAQSKTEAA
jgi:hypothetical protein